MEQRQLRLPEDTMKGVLIDPQRTCILNRADRGSLLKHISSLPHAEPRNGATYILEPEECNGPSEHASQQSVPEVRFAAKQPLQPTRGFLISNQTRLDTSLVLLIFGIQGSDSN